MSNALGRPISTDELSYGNISNDGVANTVDFPVASSDSAPEQDETSMPDDATSDSAEQFTPAGEIPVIIQNDDDDDGPVRNVVRGNVSGAVIQTGVITATSVCSPLDGCLAVMDSLPIRQ